MTPLPSKKPPSLGKMKEQETKPAEPSEEISTYTGEADFQKLLYDLGTEKLLLQKQKRRLRRIISNIAFGIVGFLLILECVVLGYIYNLEASDAGDLTFLAVSPIFAIAAIVVSGLLGVFRANVDDAGKVIGGASSGISG